MPTGPRAILLTVLTLASPRMAQAEGGAHLAQAITAGGPVGLAHPPLVSLNVLHGGRSGSDALCRSGVTGGRLLAASGQGPGPLVDPSEFDPHRRRGGSPIFIDTQAPLVAAGNAERSGVGRGSLVISGGTVVRRPLVGRDRAGN